MTVHTVKIRTEWWERVASGQKVAEVRKLDRDYQVGDLVELVPVREGLLGVLIRDTSRGVITAEVGHIVRGGAAGHIGVTAGYGVLSLIEVSVGEPPEDATETATADAECGCRCHSTPTHCDRCCGPETKLCEDCRRDAEAGET